MDYFETLLKEKGSYFQDIKYNCTDYEKAEQGGDIIISDSSDGVTKYLSGHPLYVKHSRCG